MVHKRKVNSLSIFILFLVLQSCTSFFVSKDALINISCPTDSIAIYNGCTLLGIDKVHYKFLKREMSQEFVFKKNGFLDKTFAINVQKRLPMRLSFLFDDKSSNKNPNKKEFKVSSLIKEPLRKTDSQKFIQIKNVSINLKKEDTLLVTYENEKNFLISKISAVESAGDEIDFDASNYNSKLTKFISKYNYVDTV